jgi:hypothetical protein
MAGVSQYLANLGDNLRGGANLATQFGATRMNALLGLVRGLARGDNLVAGPGIRLDKTSGQVTIKSDAGRGSTAAVAPPQPFQVTLRPNPESETSVLASVWPGTVNGLLPTNYTVEATLSKTGDYYVILRCTCAGQQVTGVEIMAPTTQPEPAAVIPNALPSTVDVLMAIVAQGTLFQIRTGNLTLAPSERFRQYKAEAEPGTLPWDSYWTWRVTS